MMPKDEPWSFISGYARLGRFGWAENLKGLNSKLSEANSPRVIQHGQMEMKT